MAFLGVLAVVVVQAVPSLRYKQSAKYDHSFITNLMGETSRRHPGPGAKTQQPPVLVSLQIAALFRVNG